MKYFKSIIIVSMLLFLGTPPNLLAQTTLSTRGASIASLYLATFNRFPDIDGLVYWENTSLDIEEIAQSFFDQRETQLAYPSRDTSVLFVEKVYQNFLQRLPDDSGLVYWEGELDSNRIARGAFILAIIQGAQSSDKNFIDQRARVMSAFLNSGLNNTKSEEILEEFSTNGETGAIALISELSNESERITKFGNAIIELVSYPEQTIEESVTVKITNDGVPQRILVELESATGTNDYPITLTMTTATGRVLYHYTDIVITVEKIEEVVEE